MVDAIVHEIQEGSLYNCKWALRVECFPLRLWRFIQVVETITSEVWQFKFLKKKKNKDYSILWPTLPYRNIICSSEIKILAFTTHWSHPPSSPYSVLFVFSRLQNSTGFSFPPWFFVTLALHYFPFFKLTTLLMLILIFISFKMTLPRR